MKKKILFMVINMNIGGTEKSLLNLIDEIPEDQYEITIFMLEKYGAFLNHIPKRVNILYLETYPCLKKIINEPPRKTIHYLFKKKKIIKGTLLLTLILISKITKNNSLLFKYLLKNTPVLKTEYDIAIAYAGPMDLISYFVVHKLRSKKKFQWIHFDVTKIGFNNRFAAKLYKNFNKIFVVSEEGKSKLINQLPELRDRISLFHNVISPKLIRKMANKDTGFEDEFNGIRILTVGRLSKEKGQDLAITVLSILKHQGFRIRWYCIGEGSARHEYEKIIKEYQLEKDFVLLGATSNPYPYMMQCDVYVQLSRHEGYCITLAEAKCFNKPIVTTSFSGAKEQLSHYSNGIIVNFDQNEVVQQLKELLKTIENHKKLISINGK